MSRRRSLRRDGVPIGKAEGLVQPSAQVFLGGRKAG
jgi:hypothetical protein